MGDPEEVQKRLAAVRGIPELAVSHEAESLAGFLLNRGILPQRASIDALHLAMAAVHDIDYLLTWNCKHLANARILNRVRLVLEGEGLYMPAVITPQQLMGEDGDG